MSQNTQTKNKILLFHLAYVWCPNMNIHKTFKEKVNKIMQAMFVPDTMKSIKKAYNVRYDHVLAEIMIYERQETSKYRVLESIIYRYN